MASGAPKAKKFGSKTTAQEVVSEFSAQVTGRTFLITVRVFPAHVNLLVLVSDA